MALEKWHPLRELEGMRREMDRIMEGFFPAAGRALHEFPWAIKAAAEKGVATPPIDIMDKEDTVLVVVEMPGVRKDDIEISFQDDTLIVKGEIKGGNAMKEGSRYYSERHYCCYSRAINIPFKITPGNITAALKDGILSIHLPKTKEAQPKKITVEVG